jgi:hypothetical protein
MWWSDGDWAGTLARDIRRRGRLPDMVIGAAPTAVRGRNRSTSERGAYPERILPKRFAAGQIDETSTASGWRRCAELDPPSKPEVGGNALRGRGASCRRSKVGQRVLSYVAAGRPARRY